MKHIVITKCGECPHFEYAYSTDNCRYVCEHIDMNRKPIEDAEIIQEWCPLLDYKKGGEPNK